MRYNASPNTILLAVLAILCEIVGADPNFNDSIRRHSTMEELASHNKTNPSAKTLQRELHGRQASFVPSRYPYHHGYQEVPDNALSSSSYSRGITHHDVHAVPDYIHDYEETPHISHGPFIPEVHHFDPGHGYLNHHHEPEHEQYHSVGYGHHYKHYDHGLKAILLPVAGLAILGAAAALVSNPVLLQLGVISGRRRRDTDEITTGPDGPIDPTQIWRKRYEPLTNAASLDNERSDFQRKVLLQNAPMSMNRLFRYKDIRSTRPVVQLSNIAPDIELIPVPLIERRSAGREYSSRIRDTPCR